MMFDARWESRLGALTIVGGLLLAAGCSDDDDGSDGSSSGSSGSSSGSSGSSGGGGSGSGQKTFSCGKAGKYCIEYSGSASSIDAIRDATKCLDQGAVEGTGCAKEGAVICTLPQNGSTGTGGAQYYYGVEEDDLASLKSTCEGSGGTFSAP
jgi:hypothetical protein